MSDHASNEHANPHQFTIVVNGRAVSVAKNELSFEEIVALAFPQPSGDGNTIYTVTYRRGQNQKPEGTLVQRESIHISEGMIFNVTPTTRS